MDSFNNQTDDRTLFVKRIRKVIKKRQQSKRSRATGANRGYFDLCDRQSIIDLNDETLFDMIGFLGQNWLVEI